MIKSNFQLEKEKERSILDCITSITGKLDEATVVGFSAPMGGIAGAQPSWATQRAKALTNPVLPPLQAGQSTPFVAKGPFVPQGQAQQPQAAQYQTAMAGTVPAGALPVGTGMAMQSAQQAAEVKGRDAWERSRAGKFDYKNEVLPSANFDPVVIDARKALANTQNTSTPTPPVQPSRTDQTIARAKASSADTQDLLARGRDIINQSKASHERSVAASNQLRQTMNNMPQTSRPSYTLTPDIVELSPDERYRRTMASGDFNGAGIPETVNMKERAMKERAMKEKASGQVQSAGDAQAISSAKEIAMTPEQREARKLAREAAEDKQEKEKQRIYDRLQIQRTARNTRETGRLDKEEEAQKNRERERDQKRRRYSRPIYDQDGSVTDSFSGENIGMVSSGGNNGSGSRGIVSSGRSGLGGGAGGSRLPESFNPSSSRLEEVAGVGPAGIAATNAAHAATQAYNKQIKDAAAAAAKNTINFVKDYAPKVGYIVGTPPRELAATATGRLAGLGYSDEGALNRFKYYRQGLDTVRNSAKGLIGFGANLFGLPKVGNAINKGIDMATNNPIASAAAD